METITKLDIRSKTILFLGYGAVAKCVWNYFDLYFEYDPDRVHAIDQFESAFTGPKVELLHRHVGCVMAETFDSWTKKIGLRAGDIIIDLTYDSSTYFFVKRCVENGFHYLNTSIEDSTDSFQGASIDAQQDHLNEVIRDCIPFSPNRDDCKSFIKSNILTECGQNPGLIQHYILFALNRMRQLQTGDNTDDYKRTTLVQTIRDYQVGTIFCSEYDDQVASAPLPVNAFVNTWSVSGFLAEALEPTELVRGRNNTSIQPYINPSLYHKLLMTLYPQPAEYEVLFLTEPGIHVTLPTISPVWHNGRITYMTYRGKLIHHGEIFDMARVLGADAPFMSYVYRANPIMEKSVVRFFKTYPCSEANDAILYANQPDTFVVMDQRQQVTGQDSIGATLFCGKDSIERIFWCGSLFRDTDPRHPYFTPTIVQVAAGVLSGLSYIMEKRNANRGWLQSSDLDTNYMIQKSKDLLGLFYFTEIPIQSFPYKLNVHKTVLIPELSKSRRSTRCSLRK